MSTNPRLMPHMASSHGESNVRGVSLARCSMSEPAVIATSGSHMRCDIRRKVTSGMWYCGWATGP